MRKSASMLLELAAETQSLKGHSPPPYASKTPSPPPLSPTPVSPCRTSVTEPVFGTITGWPAEATSRHLQHLVHEFGDASVKPSRKEPRRYSDSFFEQHHPFSVTEKAPLASPSPQLQRPDVLVRIPLPSPRPGCDTPLKVIPIVSLLAVPGPESPSMSQTNMARRHTTGQNLPQPAPLKASMQQGPVQLGNAGVQQQQALPQLHPTITDEWLRSAANSALLDDSGNSKAVGPSGGGTGMGTAQRSASSIMSSSPTTPLNVIEEFNTWRNKPELAVAVAAIKALTAVIRRSEASTMMGLEIELRKASETLKGWDKSSISLSAACNLFMRYVTRTSALECEDIAAGKARLIERGEKFSEISLRARNTIAKLGQDFVRDGSVILTHGFSRVVVLLLKMAAASQKHFSVICTEGRPDARGLQTARELSAAGIPVTVVLDAGVAYMMERIDMVLVGAEGVVESGGIINNLGTYQVAMVARAMNRPVYVAAESYKFARLYPLDQKDLPMDPKPTNLSVPLPPSVNVVNPSRDYTPPSCLTLLFTDLGVLTPSAVSDELIQLYL